MTRHQGMRELVHHDGAEQAERGQDSHPSKVGGGQAAVLVRKVADRQRPDNEQRDEQPTGVRPYFKSKQLKEPDSVSEHWIPSYARQAVRAHDEAPGRGAHIIEWEAGDQG